MARGAAKRSPSGREEVIALDTNILLRLVTHDDPAQLAAIERFVGAHPDETFMVPDLVLAEVVWTLRAKFRWERPQIAAALRRLATKPDVRFADRDHVTAGIDALEAGGDFADELIVGAARAQGCMRLATFDAGLAARHPGFAVRPK
jgi:predicted nucleic-acid-binding protein